MKTEYDIQAEQFAKATGLTMTASYLGHYSRDSFKEAHVVSQWNIILTVPNKEPYIFKYSQSIYDSWKHLRESSRTQYKKGLHNRVDIKKFMARASKGDIPSYIKKDIIKPTLYDVLSCLTKYDPWTFQDFCSSYGYDTDSRTAESIYFDVQKEYSHCVRLFGTHMSELEEIV